LETKRKSLFFLELRKKMDLFRFVSENDAKSLEEYLRSTGGADINIRSPEDGSTPLHFAASTGDLNCLKILLRYPNIKIDVQNNEGNTPLHVATAYTHLQSIKMLLKAGDRPHSLHVTNLKNKQPIDYAWNSEVKAFLEDYHQAFYLAYSLSNDPDVLRKRIINMISEVNEFQDRCKDVLHQLIEQKHVALHKVNLLEQAAGIKDEGSANNYINQLSYLQDMNERQTADIAALKNKIQLLERSLANNNELKEFQEARSQAKPEESNLEQFEEDRKKQDLLDEQSGQVLFVTTQDGSKQLKGGTKEKLVERLTAYGANFDLQYLQAFLLTYRAFMTPDELFLLISKAWDSMENQDVNKALPIRLRVVNTIKYWMENYWFDFTEDQKLCQRLQHLVNDRMSSQPKLQKQLTRALERKLSGQDTDILEKKPVNCPKPIYTKKTLARKASATPSDSPTPKMQRQQSMMKAAIDTRPKSVSLANLEKLKSKMKLGLTEDASDDSAIKFTDFDPLELARQMTLIEFELFKAIKPTEFLDQAWLNKEKEKLAPGIMNMTRWSTKMSKWVITEIVTESNVKVRASLYERFVALAQHLEKLNNFNGCIEILTGLQASPIYRLKDTLTNVNSRVRKIADDMMKTSSSELNYKKLRERVHASDPPLIPFPGVYLQDLVFLDAGSKSFLDAEKRLINFQKHLTCARYIQELLGYQHANYALEPVPDIQDFLRNVEVIYSEDEQYNKSLECEPRT